MNLISSLKTYINAQENVGLTAMIFGGLLLVGGFLFYQFGHSPLARGMRNGLWILGVIVIFMGAGLRVHQRSLLKRQIVLLQNNAQEFKQIEKSRMQKVKNGYPYNQAVMTFLLLMVLLGSFLIKNEFWQGVLLSISIVLVAFIIIESFSYISIKTYYNQLNAKF